MLRWHISELWVTIVNVQESDFLLLTSPEDLSPQSARVATQIFTRKYYSIVHDGRIPTQFWQCAGQLIPMGYRYDFVLSYLEFSYQYCRSIGVPSSQQRDVAPVSTSQRILHILSRLSFLKILLLDIGLSLCDSITDLVQASRDQDSFIFLLLSWSDRWLLQCIEV